jgi:hypothetical protein
MAINTHRFLSELEKKIFEYGDWREQFGYAEAACKTPFPSNDALEAREFARDKVYELQAAVELLISRHGNDLLADSRSEVAGIFKAIVDASEKSMVEERKPLG